jgi:hypothetical protein
MVLDTVSYGTAGLVAGLTGAIVVAVRLASPGVDPSEPPLLKPRVPILGHLVAMMREKAGFYRRLQ